MANALGRISGQLLKDNLTRNGEDLRFDDLDGPESLLKLNVTNRYISINADSAYTPLFVNGKSRTTYLEVPTALIGLSSLKLQATGNTIVSTQETSPGSGFTVLNFSAATQVTANIIDTDNIRINNNVISTKTLNTNLDLNPAGSLNVYSNLNVTGSLWAKETAPSTKGNITLDGNITFGSTDQSGTNADTISFNADINTDITPNLNETYRLGSSTLQWEGLYSELINGEQVNSNSIASSGIDLALRQGKIWYVATNGSDANVGDHQNGAFATIKHALDESSDGDTVYIYPGTYTEIFPLTVKVGVTVKGTGIRSVTVQPTVLTQSNNAFLLNGESTISDLTVKDFYAPGYAFAFAPGFTVSTRSPYVQNITVITKGSVTSSTDPRGFDEGDAGGGARVDGSLATSSSKEASMLFHSVTFITPGVDALVMTNGVRVEWLNSFTYFANRGLYATQGTLGLASLGIRFGAEIRSIGSANVYGNYGAEANGASALMYLVQHNFAYIGAGKDVTNDASLGIVANETVELAGGKIYYQSMDNKGNFKVGDAFGVSFETGRVTINGVSVSAGGVTSINFAAGTDETVIDATQVTVNNVKFSNNLITTLSGALNLDSGTGAIKLNADTDVDNNLDITGNLNINGKLTIGNAYIDVVRFEAPVEFDLRPVTDDDYNLGGPTNKRWDKVYLDTSYIGSYKLENATILTLSTNADVELRANSTGKIYVPTNNVEIDNDLTVSGTTNFGDNAATLAATVTGTIDHTGLLSRTGDTGQTGTYNQTGYLDASSDVQIANVTFIDDTISTVTLNSNLALGAAGTGKIKIPSADVQIDHNLFVTSDIHAGSLGASTDITADSYSNGDISISLDLIETTLTDSDLEFRAAGTGKVYASQDSVKFDQDLTVNTATGLRTTLITGALTHYGDYLQTGNTLQTGNRSISSTLDVDSNAYFDSMSFVNNAITTTDANADLVLKAALTGIIDINDNATFNQNLQINSTTYTNGITNSGITDSDTFSDGDIEISTNIIKTTVGTNDLRLLAAGTGSISVPNDSAEFNLNLTVNGTTNLKNTVIGTGGLTPVPKILNLTGNYLQTGDTLQTGNRSISLTLDVDSNAYFDSMSFVNNTIATTDANADLILKAVGSGIVDINDNITIDQNLRVNSTTYTNGITNSGITSSDTFSDGDIEISSNNIKTTIGTNDLRLLAAGTGSIAIPNDAVQFDLDLTVIGTTNLKNTVIGTGGLTPAPQNLTLIGNYIQTGNTLQTGNRSISLTLDVDSNAYFDSMSFVNNAITITDADTDLRLTAVGSGIVDINDNITIDQNLRINSTTYTNGITNSGITSSDTFSDGDIEISSNNIKTTIGTNDLRLLAAGTGIISIPNDAVDFDLNLTVGLNTSLKNTVIGTGGLTPSPKILNLTGNYLQTGNTLQTGNRSISSTLDVDSNAYFDSMSFVNNAITITDTNTDLRLTAAGTGIVNINDNVTIDQNLRINSTTYTNGITNSGIVASDTFSDGDIEISTNTIKTTVGNNNLRLLAAGTGIISVPNDSVQFDQNLTINGTTNLKNTVIGTGTALTQVSQNLSGTSSPTGFFFYGWQILTPGQTVSTFSVIQPGWTVVGQPTWVVSVVGDGVTNYDITITGGVFASGGTYSFTGPLPSTITHVGDYNQTGNTLQTGNRTITGTLYVTNNLYFDNINIVDNRIFTTNSNDDLELKAAGSGIVQFNDNLRIVNDLTVGTLTTNGISNSLTVTSDIFTNNNINIVDNKISTTVTDANIILSSNGTGKVKTVLTDVTINQTLDVADTTSLKNTAISGLLDISGDYTQIGAYTQTGNRDVSAELTVTNNVYFDNINIVDNRIFTTNSNDSLELRATGKVVVNDNLQLSQAALFGTLVTNGLTNTGTITSDVFSDSNIEINDNYITTTVANNDLRLVPNGIGKLSLPLDPLAIVQGLTVEDDAILKNTTINGDLVHVGNTTQTGNVGHTGDFDLSNNLTVTGTDAVFTDVHIINNRIATSTGNNNLELRANGTGIINITDFATFGQTLTVNGTMSTATLSTVTGTITSDIFSDNDIEINDNYITTTVGNNNLILNGNGTGALKLEKLKFNSTTLSIDNTDESIILSIPTGSVLIDAVTALKIPVGTTANRPTLTQGELRFDTTDNLFRGYSTSAVTFAGIYSTNRLTRVLAHPTNNTVGFTTNNSTAMTVSSTGFTVNALVVDNLLFSDNTISSTSTNTDVTLDANGTGYVKIDDIAIESNKLLNLNATDPLILQNTGTGYVKFAGTGGLAIPAGDNAGRPLNPEIGDVRWNTELSTAEVFNGIDYQGFSDEGGDLLSAAQVQEVTNLWALVLG